MIQLKNHPPVPDGYEVVGYAPPVRGQKWLDGDGDVVTASQDYEQQEAHLIVRKKRTLDEITVEKLQGLILAIRAGDVTVSSYTPVDQGFALYYYSTVTEDNNAVDSRTT